MQLIENIKPKLTKRAAEFYATHNDDAREKIMSGFGPWLKSQNWLRKEGRI